MPASAVRTGFPLGAFASERAEWKTEMNGGRLPRVSARRLAFTRGYCRIISPGFRFALAREGNGSRIRVSAEVRVLGFHPQDGEIHCAVANAIEDETGCGRFAED